MIWSSDMPTLCICAMRSLAGLEKWHSSMLHVATESLHPHWQASRAPTRRTSRLGFSAAVCAIATAASSANNSHNGGRAVNPRPTPSARPRPLTFFNGCMFLRNAHHFRAGVLHLDLTGNQADEGAADQHQAADPNPRHQREHVRLNHGPLV